MSIERVTPGTFVMVNDVLAGGRKLALVDDSGTGYYDLHGDNELPKPIHSDLQPQGLGSIASWLSALDGPFADEMVKAWDQLTAKHLDVLTIARALRWGLENQIADVEQMERFGKGATESISRSRSVVQQAIAA